MEASYKKDRDIVLMGSGGHCKTIIEHECKIDSNVHIAPGARLAGGVEVMKNSMIGIGANIIQNVTIGENCIIGAGSVVLGDIHSNSIGF